MNEKKTRKKIFKKELIKSENFLDNKKRPRFEYSFFRAGKARRGHGKFLIIYPIGTLGDIIARVPNRSDNIVVTDFKTFRYDIDIPYRANEK